MSNDQISVGTIIDNHYQLLEFIGEGGMSIVYKAKHLMLDRIVAIKMLKQISDTSGHRLKRFQQEAKALSALSHPNIIGLLDFGILPQGMSYMVMDFVKGTSLAEIIDNGNLPDLKRSIHIFTEACAGLYHAHQKGFLHRDMKPSNIMIVKTESDSDLVKILDFGIAKLLPWADNDRQILTQTGEVFGSPLYMSPEQCQGNELDVRSDIYAMGCIMYETLTGVPPLMGQNMLETIQMHIIDTPKPISDYCKNVPESLASIIMKAMEKEPEARQQSMLELQEELNQVDLSNTTNRIISKHAKTKVSIKTKDNTLTALIGQKPKLAIACIIIVLLILMSVLTHVTTIRHNINQAGKTALWERYTLQGQIAFHNQNYVDAEYEFTNALNQAKHFGKHDKRLTESMKNLHNVYLARGEFKEAAFLESQITNTAKKRLLTQYRNADLELNKLIDLSLSVVPKVYNKHKAAEYQELSDTLNNLANVCLEQGKLDKAEKLFKIALDIDKNVFGTQSWQTALKMNNLAYFYIKENQYEKAKPLLEESMPIMQKSLQVSSTIKPFSANGESQASMDDWLKEYANLLRVLQKDIEANEVEKHINYQKTN